MLVKWHNLPDFESSWELADDIKLSFPDFHLEDKVLVQGEGIVRDHVPEGIKVYRRKKYRGKLGNTENRVEVKQMDPKSAQQTCCAGREYAGNACVGDSVGKMGNIWRGLGEE